MAKGPKDLNQAAFDIVAKLTGGSTSKNVARASEGGKERAAKLTHEQRVEIAKKAAPARWGKTQPGQA